MTSPVVDGESDANWPWNWNQGFDHPEYHQYHGWNWQDWHDDSYYHGRNWSDSYYGWNWSDSYYGSTWSDYSQAGSDHNNANVSQPEPWHQWWQRVSRSTSTTDEWWGSDWQNTIGWVWNDQARWIFLRADGLVWQWVCGNAEVGD